LVIASAVHRRTAPRRAATIAFLRRVTRQVSLPRALAEATLLVVAWFLLFSWLDIERGPDVLITMATFASSASALAAIRLRRVDASLAGVAYELSSTVLASAWLAGVQLAFGAVLYNWRTIVDYLYRGTYSVVDGMLVWAGFTLLNGAVFAVVRTVAVGIPWWLRFQQRKLRWQLVHSQLMVVVLLGLIPLALFGSAILRGELTDLFRGSAPAGNALVGLGTAIAFALAVTIVLLAIGMAVVLPPSILVSYLAARRTTRRLEHLAGTAAALRDGRFDARVTVQGVDEVAQLQTDINAMATTLQRSMSELSAERDTVQSLLDQRQELVASVSHELRTPVAIMRGYLDAALAQDDSVPPGLREDLQVMHTESLRLQRLIDDLFVLTRASVAQLPLNVAAVDVAPLLEQAVAAVAPGAWSSSRVEVILVLHPEGNLPPIAVDPDRLTQIVLNVVNNAVRHSPPGGIVLITAEEEGGRVAIRIADTGEGIPPDELDRIWERFYRGANATDPRGSGLGLALSRELTEAMGGDASVSSTPGEETVFTFWFPVATRGLTGVSDLAMGQAARH
jgi:signal transduction histidine kinase